MSLRIDGHDVTLARSGDHAVITIDGRAFPLHRAGAVLEMEGRRETFYAVSDHDHVFIHAFGRAWKLEVTDPAERSERGGAGADGAVAPMPGVVVSVAVAPGDAVTRGQVLMVIESMKMHSEILAPRDGVIDRVLAQKGETFDMSAPLVMLVPAEAEK